LTKEAPTILFVKTNFTIGTQSTMGDMAATAQLDLIHQPQRAAAMLHPLRLRLMERLREPGSASGIAGELGLPRQRVNYHLRELEKEGLVELVEERRRGNCTERILKAKARHYLIAPEVLGKLAADPDQIGDRLSSTYLLAVAAQAIRDLSVLRAKADAAGKKLATFTLQSEIAFASASDRNAFAEELANEVARLTAKYHDDRSGDRRRFKLVLGVYPEVKEEMDG
jgi:DNA-binding transcriptional ArsR family regulator